MKWHRICGCCALILIGGLFAGCGGNETGRKLIHALASGDTATADALIDDKNFNVNSANNQGVTPLLQSLVSHNREIYAKLLERGADPNICDGNGRCVMNQAAKESDSFWLREALAHGGDPDALNSGNRHYPNSTPLFYAIHKERPGITPRVENIRLLIKGGANVNHRDSYGRTPLREAAEAGNYESIVDLLAAGADPLQGDKHGYTLVNWFNGRAESRVSNEEQKPWFTKAADVLIERGVLERDSDGKLRKK